MRQGNVLYNLGQSVPDPPYMQQAGAINSTIANTIGPEILTPAAWSASQRIAQFPIEQSMNLFHALEGRYPKDHDEFMQRIIKENKMQLPEPAKGFAYQYDVANHTLVVVRKTADDK